MVLEEMEVNKMTNKSRKLEKMKVMWKNVW